MMGAISELIGMNSVVVESTNKSLIGISGMIINETKNMLILNTKLGEKSIPKSTCKFEVTKNDKIDIINGLDLLKRPHERLEVLL